jgi:prophage antirepressor-like protein
MTNDNQIVFYEGPDGKVKLPVSLLKKEVWLSLQQIADLFEVDKSGISRHLKRILSDKELDHVSVVAKNATTAADGKTYQVDYYSLDAILAVGYRVNSRKATHFRRWATSVLRDFVFNGFVINPHKVEHNYQSFLAAVENVKKLLPPNNAIDATSVVELIKSFASTWFSLDAYDKSELPQSGATKKQVLISAEELTTALGELKQDLLEKGEASELFGQERSNGSICNIVSNIFQSFGGEDLYPSLEEKAAHLLYFMVKNHPFIDGNKRSGAFAFIWFIGRAQLLDLQRLSPEALTALTLFTAESDPKEKDRMIGVILQLITR